MKIPFYPFFSPPEVNFIFRKRLSDYVIRKLITHLKKKTSRLHNPEANLMYRKDFRINPEANHKRLLDYIIRKLILNLEKDFRIM